MAREAQLTVGVAVHIALTGYERLVPAALSGKLAEWASRLSAAAERLRAIDESDG
jgi:hypothetical protein